MSFTHPRAKLDFGGYPIFLLVPRLFWRSNARPRTSLALGVGSSIQCPGRDVDESFGFVARLGDHRATPSPLAVRKTEEYAWGCHSTARMR